MNYVDVQKNLRKMNEQIDWFRSEIKNYLILKANDKNKNK